MNFLCDVGNGVAQDRSVKISYIPLPSLQTNAGFPTIPTAAKPSSESHGSDDFPSRPPPSAYASMPLGGGAGGGVRAIGSYLRGRH